MIIDIFGLLPGAREVDRQNLVATVDVTAAQVTVIHEVRGRIVRELFENDFSSLQAPGDSTVDHPAWAPATIEQILNEELPALSLRGIIRSPKGPLILEYQKHRPQRQDFP